MHSILYAKIFKIEFWLAWKHKSIDCQNIFCSFSDLNHSNQFVIGLALCSLGK